MAPEFLGKVDDGRQSKIGAAELRPLPGRIVDAQLRPGCPG